jgi:hypothetical protein
MTKNNPIKRKQASTPDLKAATTELNRARREAANAKKRSDLCREEALRIIGELKASMSKITAKDPDNRRVATR